MSVGDNVRNIWEADTELAVEAVRQRIDAPLTLEKLMKVTFVDYGSVRRIVGDSSVDPDEINVLTPGEEEMYRKWLSAMITEEQAIEIAKKHIEPLGLEDEYIIEFKAELNPYRLFYFCNLIKAISRCGGSGKSAQEQDTDKGIRKSVPPGYIVSMTIKYKKTGAELKENIEILVRDYAIEEDEFKIKWSATSNILSKSWIADRFGEKRLYALVVEVRSEEEAKAVYEQIFNNPFVAGIWGMNGEMLRDIILEYEGKLVGQGKFTIDQRTPEESIKKLEEMGASQFPHYKAKPERINVFVEKERSRFERRTTEHDV